MKRTSVTLLIASLTHLLGDRRTKTALFRILTGEESPDEGSFRWGTTVTTAYFPKDNSYYFESKLNLIEWLRQYTEVEEETFVRGFFYVR